MFSCEFCEIFMAASEYFESKYLGRLVVHIFSKKYVHLYEFFSRCFITKK